MSVQVGIRYFDGKFVDFEDVMVLLSGLESRGPDYEGVKVMGSIGMGFRGMNVALEDRDDQPLYEKSCTAVTFDGRLDNRSQIASRVEIDDYKDLSDAMLVLLLFERFAAQSFEMLKGEFACVVWDETRRSLFMSRSPCGTRPLFYVKDSKRIIWSSEIDDLIVKVIPDCIVNDTYAIGFLFYQSDNEESPFNNVSIIPCGSYVEVTNDGVLRCVNTWHPERIRPLHLKGDREYEEAWKAEVKAILRARTRVSGGVFCALSGGIDSSVLAVLTDQVLQESGRNPNLMTTVSCVYETSKSSDEREFIVLVEDILDRQGLHISEKEQGPCLGLEEIQFTGLPNTFHCLPGRYPAIRKAMLERQSRIMLTGVGGDEVFWADSRGTPAFADLLKQARLLRLISESRKWSAICKSPLAELILTSAIGGITSTSRLLYWDPWERYLKLPWITLEAQKRLAARRRNAGQTIDTRIALPSQRMKILSIKSVWGGIAAGYFREYSDIQLSHPFTAQDLVDFVLSLPIDQLTRPGEGRSLMRRAMKGLLPDQIRMRLGKGSLGEVFSRTIAREKDKIGEVRQFEVCRRGYAIPDQLAGTIRSAAEGNLDQIGMLMRLFSLERWLRSLEMIPKHHAYNSYNHYVSQKSSQLNVAS